MTSSAVVEFENASFAYGKNPPALTGVTGEVNAGEALALIGANGAGKTTLLRGILGQLNVTGTMRVAPGGIGYVPQLADLDDSFPVTAFHVVAMGLVGSLRKVDKQRVNAALAAVGMEERASIRFGDLSGGQRQRVLLARALVAQPKLILLDEPFNGLDQENRAALLDIVRKAKAEGVALIMSTHDMVLVDEAAEKVAVLAGKQLAFGPVEQCRDYIAR